MKNDILDVILIRGAPGSGKSTVAKQLAPYFPKGVRMEVDILRLMVISVDWTNQREHIEILQISAGLACDFLYLGFKPVIVVDTFSSGKLAKYRKDLRRLKKNLKIGVFGLYASEKELRRRIQSRKKGEFRKYSICHNLNEEVQKHKYRGEYQFNTTGRSPEETAKLIFARCFEK